MTGCVCVYSFVVVDLFLLLFWGCVQLSSVMAKSCANCVRLSTVVEDQKNKLQLLETRLKDLVRAYKVVCKEKDNLLNSNVATDIDTKQQKRIAELEENVIRMSAMCGKFELEKIQDKEQIEKLEIENDKLKSEIEKCLTQVPQPPPIVEISPLMVECKNKHSQTDNPFFTKEISNQQFEDKVTQTEFDEPFCLNKNFLKTKNETAIVPPIRHISVSDSEISVFSDDLGRSVENINISDSDHIEQTHSVHNEPSPNNSGVSLFYVNELARKEIELTEYRLRVRELECSIRELQWKYTNDKYKYVLFFLKTPICNLIISIQ